MTELYTLDANILFYAVDVDAGYKHTIAQDLVRHAPHSSCLITLQALGEVYNSVSRRKPQHRGDAELLLVSLEESVPIVSANIADVLLAIQEQKRRPLQFWDTLLWATAWRHGCSTILTEDAQSSDVVGGVRYLNPFTAHAAELAPYRR